MTNQTPSDTDEWLDEILVFTGHYDTGQIKAAIQAKFAQQQARHLEEVRAARTNELKNFFGVENGSGSGTFVVNGHSVIERIRYLEAEGKV